MERLTSRDEKGNLNVDGKEVYAGYLYNAVALLEEYEDTGLTPEQIMELKEAVQKLENIFGDEITINQVIDFFVDFYIAQGDPDRSGKSRTVDKRRSCEVAGAAGAGYGEETRANEDGMVCPICGSKAVPWSRFCDECGQRWWEKED